MCIQVQILPCVYSHFRTPTDLTPDRFLRFASVTHTVSKKTMSEHITTSSSCRILIVSFSLQNVLRFVQRTFYLYLPTGLATIKLSRHQGRRAIDSRTCFRSTQLGEDHSMEIREQILHCGRALRSSRDPILELNTR